MRNRILGIDLDNYLTWYEEISMYKTYPTYREILNGYVQRSAAILPWIKKRYESDPQKYSRSLHWGAEILKKSYEKIAKIQNGEMFPEEWHYYPTPSDWKEMQRCRGIFLQHDHEKVTNALKNFRNNEAKIDYLKDELNKSLTYNYKYIDSLVNSTPIQVFKADGDFNYLNLVTEINHIERAQYINNLIQENETSTPGDGIKKIRWTGSIIELITMYFDMLETTGLIQGSKADIAKMIVDNYTDKAGNPIKQSYVLKILKPKEEKAKNRVDFKALL